MRMKNRSRALDSIYKSFKKPLFMRIEIMFIFFRKTLDIKRELWYVVVLGKGVTYNGKTQTERRRACPQT